MLHGSWGCSFHHTDSSTSAAYTDPLKQSGWCRVSHHCANGAVSKTTSYCTYTAWLRCISSLRYCKRVPKADYIHRSCFNNMKTRDFSPLLLSSSNIFFGNGNSGSFIRLKTLIDPANNKAQTFVSPPFPHCLFCS